MNPNIFVLGFLKIRDTHFSTLMAVFAFSIFFVSLNLMPIGIHVQASAGVNTTFSQGNFSLQEEKQRVQKDLADLMRKAINIGGEIPEISGFEENNATLYVKVNVNNTGERIANASDFYFTVNYQSEPTSPGVVGIYGSDAGVIVRLPEGTYGLMSQRSQTGDPVKDSFINSFGLSSYSGDCFGKIRSGESKECTITKSVLSNNTSNGANFSKQEPQIIENDTGFQSPGEGNFIVNNTRNLSSPSTMDFELFMDSFTNSIFNGTSIFGGLGASMVNGVKVSGISLDSNVSRLSVTLSGTPTDMLVRNNVTSLTNDTTTITNAESLNSVSVIAMRVPINLADILSLAQNSSSLGLDSGMMTRNMGFNQDTIFPSDSFNPLSLLSGMQIGSSSLTNAVWSVPQTVTMDLVGGDNNQEQQQSYSNNTSAADFLFVSVIPYTGTR